MAAPSLPRGIEEQLVVNCYDADLYEEAKLLLPFFKVSFNLSIGVISCGNLLSKQGVEKC